jgi:D-tyrosyl-tRNA(Tyr) deacylase
MRAVVQRVTRAAVRVRDRCVAEIEQGMLVLIGVSADDSESDVLYLAEKIVSLRIFDDEGGKMNLSVIEAGGSILAVSQFTLYGDVRRGRRPSWSEAAPPDEAERLYQMFVDKLREKVRHVETGMFRAMMQVELVNAGPVTILVDSKKTF